MSAAEVMDAGKCWAAKSGPVLSFRENEAASPLASC
jgi:hypothetical protein